MKKTYTALSLLLIALIFITACSEVFLQVRENLLRMGEIQEIGLNTASVNGLLLDVGEDFNLKVQAHGHCWGTGSEPTIGLDSFSDFGSTEVFGEFGTVMTELSPETPYYVRAYVTDAQGTQYSDEIRFVPGIVRNISVSNISTSRATAEGRLIESFISEVSIVGHCWSTDTRPTINNARTEFGTASIQEGTYFYSDITGLSPNTRYYIRSYAITADGVVVYGEELTFTTVE